MPPSTTASPQFENSKLPGVAAFIGGKPVILPVLAKGDSWLAVDQPAGLTVHNLPGQDLCSRVGDALQKDPMARETGYNPSFGIHPVHRLDRETSGVMLLAWDKTVLGGLSLQMQSDSTRKCYAGILHGRLPVSSDPEEWIEWDRPLTRSAGGILTPGDSIPGPAPSHAVFAG